MARTKPEEWRPIGIEDLEPNAWEALRRPGSTLVVAGPGAGKTEFLAQRAAYLLQTHTCPAPHRILAISFKRDAAANLAHRVEARCAAEEARRFVSVTFDSFTKGLVDRFGLALPEAWRPTKPYDVFLPRRRDTQEFLQRALIDAPTAWQAGVASLNAEDFEARVLGARRLTVAAPDPSNGEEFAAGRWWQERLGGPRSGLTFTCLNRLAELAIRTNPQLQRALLTTYPFVFVDEFQDTTYAQYDFLASLFSSSGIYATAVGDDKQRIMTWAGAREDVFAQFESDFEALRIPLTLNHRSSPGLVRIQLVIARSIDAGAAEVESTKSDEIDGDVAQVWHFPTAEREAETLAGWLRSDMDSRDRSPRDYAILVRQRADVFEEQLESDFDRAGISLRNESRALGRTTLQDLLADEVARVGIALLRLGVHQRAPEAWTVASEALTRIRAARPDDDEMNRRVQEELRAFVQAMRKELRAPVTPDAATAVVGRVFEFLDAAALKRAYPEHGDGDSIEIVIEAFALHMKASAAVSGDWIGCLDLFEGSDSTPLMTVHRSKGLEYDTIIFLGLDDDSWWSRQAGDVEGLSTFFVALSRAMQRAIFTYCEGRGRKRVADLYQLLTDARVPEVTH